MSSVGCHACSSVFVHLGAGSSRACIEESIIHSIQDVTFLLPSFLLLKNMFKTNACLTEQFCGLSELMYVKSSPNIK